MAREQEQERPTPATAESPGSPGASPSESPEERPSPSDDEGRSSGSPRASRAASSPFVADPGPAFAPGDEAPPEPDGGELHVLPDPLGWEEETVRSLLTAQGAFAHGVAGVAEEDWVYTETDLLAIAGPLTRILNRYPVTQAAAGTGDEMAVLIGFGGYATRSYQQRKAALEALAEVPEVPVSGVAAEPGTGPPPEPSAEPAADEIEWGVPQ